MISKFDLSQSIWGFALSKEPIAFDAPLSDTAPLPSTVSQLKKSPYHTDRTPANLTDPYFFEGYALYRTELTLEPEADCDYILHLERTRTTHVFVNGMDCGSRNSLVGAHRYDVTNALHSGKNVIAILVDNVTCPVPGGHMTSKDTQTNWLGITGEVSLQVLSKVRVENLRIAPDAAASCITVCGTVIGGNAELTASVPGFAPVSFTAEGDFSFTYDLPGAQKWSEHTPVAYELTLSCGKDTVASVFGLRTFSHEGRKLLLNGERIFLRGKHDGMIFPLTGAAPTDKEGWLKVMRVSRAHGINHYRFHTCCPPEAAFAAADELGIYMSPEIPFWGTITDEVTDAQAYLLEEGRRILDSFGNHPSFMAMSLGNELWGSKERVNAILGEYRAYDARPLYTQGSNNFQFTPVIMENEDYFVGVRFSRERLFRGSYAMCDAPQGHIQTAAPNSAYDYDEMILPSDLTASSAASGKVEIQFGEGVKVVDADGSDAPILPEKPVVSHEIGQYFMYPDYSEIDRYTGVLKARNLEIFRERMETAGLLPLADDYFRASGRFAAECYKHELEAALRSNELSGFQILDLQDFSGQGTALVGVCSALMESKGVISPEEWRTFCDDVVIMGCLDRFVFRAGETVSMTVKLYAYGNEPVIDPVVTVTLGQDTFTLCAKGSFKGGVFTLGSVQLTMPDVPNASHLALSLACGSAHNAYDLWVYADAKPAACVTDWAEAKARLAKGEKVLFMPEYISEQHSIEGTYCTDFWNYPMFNKISVSMNRARPVGTLGLLIDEAHPALAAFPTKKYSTAQWYDVVTDSRAVKLDGLNLSSIVRTMDNCERNHDLATVFEAKVGEGSLLCCTAHLDRKTNSPACAKLLESLASYAASEAFAPAQSISVEKLDELFS